MKKYLEKKNNTHKVTQQYLYNMKQRETGCKCFFLFRKYNQPRTIQKNKNLTKCPKRKINALKRQEVTIYFPNCQPA